MLHLGVIAGRASFQKNEKIKKKKGKNIFALDIWVGHLGGTFGRYGSMRRAAELNGTSAPKRVQETYKGRLATGPFFSSNSWPVFGCIGIDFWG